MTLESSFKPKTRFFTFLKNWRQIATKFLNFSELEIKIKTRIFEKMFRK